MLTRPLHGFVHDGGHVGPAHLGVCRLGLLSSTLEDVGAYRRRMERRAVTLSLNDPLHTTSASGRLMFKLFAMLVEFAKCLRRVQVGDTGFTLVACTKEKVTGRC